MRTYGAPRIAVALLLVAVATSCASSAGFTDDVQAVPTAAEPAAAAPASLADGWIAADGSATWFLDLVDVGDGTLRGTSNLTALAENGRDVVRRDSEVTGSLAGREVVLQAFDRTWSGSLDSDELRLAYTNGAGELVDVVFVRGDAETFNAAVRSINATADANQADAERVAAETASQQAAATAEAQRRATEAQQTEEVQRLIANTTESASQLRTQLASADPLDRMTNAVEDLAERVATAASASCDDALFAASDVEWSADTVSFDADSARFDLDSIQFAVDALVSNVEDLRAAGRNTQGGVAVALTDAQASQDEASAAIETWELDIASIETDAQTLAHSTIAELEGRCDI